MPTSIRAKSHAKFLVKMMNTQKNSHKNSTFIAALCRANEAKLVGEARFRRIAETSSLNEALSVLGESGFGGENKEGESYRDVIESEEKSFVEFVKENAPDSACRSHFLIPYDFGNAEALVKSLSLGLNPEKYLCLDGDFAISELTDYITSGKDCGLYPELKNAIDLAKSAFSSDKNPSGMKINADFVREKFKCQMRLAKHEFFKKIIEREVVSVDISACLRAADEEQAQKMLITVKNGKKTVGLSADKVQALVEKNAAKLKKAFEGDEYKKIAALALERYEAGLPFIELEREAKGFGTSFLNGEKFTELSGEFVFANYCYRRKNELYCAELCLTAKANGLSGDEILKRLIVV